MTLRRGFKKEANAYAKEFRLELGIKPHAPLCPLRLAEHLDIPVVPLSEFQDKIPEEVRCLTTQEAKSFSAVTVFDGMRRLIVHFGCSRPSASGFKSFPRVESCYPPASPNRTF